MYFHRYLILCSDGVYIYKIKKSKVPCHAVADKLLIEWMKRELGQYRDRESKLLILLARRILLIQCYSRYVSDTIKSCILKILRFAKNCCCVDTFWKTKHGSVTHFWQSLFFRFYYKAFRSKRILKYTEPGTFLFIDLKIFFV